MRVRLVPILSLLAVLIGLAVEPTPTAQAQQPVTGPAVILRFRSLDSLQIDAKWLIKMAGQDEAAKQVDELLKVYIQGSGVDTKKAWGAYGSISEQAPEPKAVVLVPISDSKAFLKKLDGFGLNVKDEKGGLYSVVGVVGAQDAYLRFANNYAYISNDKDTVNDQKKLVAPGLVFDPKDTAAMSLVLRVSQVPKNLKNIFLDTFKQGIEGAKAQKAPDETESQTKFKNALIDSMSEDIKNFVTDGHELALHFDVDSKNGEISADLSLTARPNTKLAASIKSWEAKSIFGSALGSDSAMNMVINTSLSSALKAAISPVIDEGIVKAVTEEKKPENKELAEKFLKAMTPTLKSGEFDIAVTMRGPSKGDKYSVVAGMKVKDGLEIDKTLRELVKKLKPEEQARITVDAEKIGDVNVHKLDIGKDVDAKAREVFGDGPMFVAFRADAVYFAAGDNALTTLKETLSAKPSLTPAFQFEMSLARFAAVAGKEDKDFAAAAEAAFGNNSKPNDKVRFTLEGGAALKLKLSAKGDALRFFSELGKRKAGLAGAN
jgi:hypothetical protein